MPNATFKQVFDLNTFTAIADTDVVPAVASPYASGDDGGYSGATIKEQIRDTIGAALVQGTNIGISVDDGADTITISFTGTLYTDEDAQDAVGGILDDGSNGDIEFTYDDGTPLISANIKAGSVDTTELADDAVDADKIDGADAADIRALISVAEVLTANRTYYVRTDGSDSNDGLTNTSGGAFLTIQKAVDTAALLNLGGFVVTIQVGNGTYNENVTAKKLTGGTVTIKGDAATPSNVVWNGSTTCFNHNSDGKYTIQGFKFTSSDNGLGANSNTAYISIKDCEFGAISSTSILASFGGFILLFGASITSSGNTQYLFRSVISGIIDARACTLTVSGTPAYSGACCLTSTLGYAAFTSASISGSATGKRYDATLNSVIDTGGGGASFLPGNSAGSTATGGQYA